MPFGQTHTLARTGISAVHFQGRDISTRLGWSHLIEDEILNKARNRQVEGADWAYAVFSYLRPSAPFKGRSVIALS